MLTRYKVYLSAIAILCLAKDGLCKIPGKNELNTNLKEYTSSETRAKEALNEALRGRSAKENVLLSDDEVDYYAEDGGLAPSDAELPAHERILNELRNDHSFAIQAFATLAFLIHAVLYALVPGLAAPGTAAAVVRATQQLVGKRALFAALVREGAALADRGRRLARQLRARPWVRARQAIRGLALDPSAQYLYHAAIFLAFGCGGAMPPAQGAVAAAQQVAAAVAAAADSAGAGAAAAAAPPPEAAAAAAAGAAASWAGGAVPLGPALLPLAAREGAFALAALARLARAGAPGVQKMYEALGVVYFGPKYKDWTEIERTVRIGKTIAKYIFLIEVWLGYKTFKDCLSASPPNIILLLAFLNLIRVKLFLSSKSRDAILEMLGPLTQIVSAFLGTDGKKNDKLKGLGVRHFEERINAPANADKDSSLFGKTGSKRSDASSSDDDQRKNKSRSKISSGDNGNDNDACEVGANNSQDSTQKKRKTGTDSFRASDDDGMFSEQQHSSRGEDDDSCTPQKEGEEDDE